MSWSDGFKVLSGIVTVALISVILASPHVAGDIRAFGSAFGGAIHQAKH